MGNHPLIDEKKQFMVSKNYCRWAVTFGVGSVQIMKLFADSSGIIPEIVNINAYISLNKSIYNDLT